MEIKRINTDLINTSNSFNKISKLSVAVPTETIDLEALAEDAHEEVLRRLEKESAAEISDSIVKSTIPYSKLDVEKLRLQALNQLQQDNTVK